MPFNVLTRSGTTKVWLSNSVATKNGSKDGTTELAQRARPDLELEIFVLEKTSISKINMQITAGKNIFFNLKTIILVECIKTHLAKFY